MTIVTEMTLTFNLGAAIGVTLITYMLPILLVIHAGRNIDFLDTFAFAAPIRLSIALVVGLGFGLVL